MNTQQKVVARMVDRFAGEIIDCEADSDADRLRVFQKQAFGEDARQAKGKPAD